MGAWLGLGQGSGERPERLSPVNFAGSGERNEIGGVAAAEGAEREHQERAGWRESCRLTRGRGPQQVGSAASAEDRRGP